jgi:alkane 1-monooxygenase
MLAELLRASGFLFVLVPPALLFASVASHQFGLAFIVLFGGSPFLRMVYGDASCHAPQWSEPVATALDRLPQAYAVAVVGCVAATLARVAGAAPTGWQWPMFGLSLWTVFIFGSCAAHELLHRRSAGSRWLGRIVAGVIGYPVLEHEHRAHHATSGRVDVPEWPRRDENMWAFSWRRLKHVPVTAWEGNIAAAQRAGRRHAGGLGLAVAAMLATAGAFTLALGARGLVLYLGVAIAVSWAIQAITYVQHWGLGRDSVPHADTDHLGWEDGCRFQRWLTLGISYHQAHHQASNVPFYRQSIRPGSPRMPAGYLVLLIASMVPAVWRRWMLPALELWMQSPDAQPAPGRRLACISRPPVGLSPAGLPPGPPVRAPR